MCIVTNLKYIITVCYDVIILYNFLQMHSFFFPLVYLNRARGYKTFTMLNSAEHEILNAYKYKTNAQMHSFFFPLVYLNRARGYKTFTMLNSAEHEILNAYKYKTIKKFCSFQAQISVEWYFSCS